jgi:hypothetical protein
MQKIYFFLILFGYSNFAISQDAKPSQSGQKDFQLWLDASLKYKVNKKFDLKFEAAYRRDNNLADVNENYIEIQARTDPFKFLVISGGYRLSGWFSEFLVNRLFGFVRFSFDLDRLRVNYRLRYDYNFNNSLQPLPKNIRNKIKIRYRTRKFPLDPFIAYEIFYRTNYSEYRFSQQRIELGISYSISKKNKINVSYRFQKQLNAVYPENNFILGISYSYKIN